MVVERNTRNAMADNALESHPITQECSVDGVNFSLWFHGWPWIPHKDSDVFSIHNNEIGLCLDCIHFARIVSSKGSAFIQCQKHFLDKEYAKYPRLPVVSCKGHKNRLLGVE